MYLQQLFQMSDLMMDPWAKGDFIYHYQHHTGTIRLERYVNVLYMAKQLDMVIPRIPQTLSNTHTNLPQNKCHICSVDRSSFSPVHTAKAGQEWGKLGSTPQCKQDLCDYSMVASGTTMWLLNGSLLVKYGGEICFLDATCKTTRYALILFFIAVKTNVNCCSNSGNLRSHL